jgi:hypothetical protein
MIYWKLMERVYNANEAGNYLWGMVLEFNDILIDPAGAADYVTRKGQGRPDESHEQKAIKAGMEFGNNINKETKEAYDKYFGNFFERLFDVNKSKKDVSTLKESKKEGETQTGREVKRESPHHYSGN